MILMLYTPVVYYLTGTVRKKVDRLAGKGACGVRSTRSSVHFPGDVMKVNAKNQEMKIAL